MKNKGPSHERWLVSYADYMTLMFAFFVVMFASSDADKQRAKQVSESVKKAYRAGIMGTPTPVAGAYLSTAPPKPELIAAPRQAPVQESSKDLMEPLETLSQELQEEIRDGKIRVRMETRGLVISLQESALFAPGADTIRMEIRQGLARIAEAIRKLPNPVRLEGHTDSTPIHTPRFRNNWALSTSRALATLDYLTEEADLPIERFSVAGYGDSLPVDVNDTAGGRARNRRVDVVILNKSALSNEPAGTGR